jgi:hypothetical protein
MIKFFAFVIAIHIKLKLLSYIEEEFIFQLNFLTLQ